MATQKKKDERMKFDIPDAVLAVFFLWGISIFFIFIINDFEQSGAFGDSFGILTAIFSGLGFIALIITLKLQREEFKETRDVLASDFKITLLLKLKDRAKVHGQACLDTFNKSEGKVKLEAAKEVLTAVEEDKKINKELHKILRNNSLSIQLVEISIPENLETFMKKQS